MVAGGSALGEGTTTELGPASFPPIDEEGIARGEQLVGRDGIAASFDIDLPGLARAAFAAGLEAMFSIDL